MAGSGHFIARRSGRHIRDIWRQLSSGVLRTPRIEDIPAENLKAGDVGTAVHTHQGKGSFDVEFFSPDGEATRIVTVPAGHLALHEEPRRDSDPPPHGIGARGSVALTQNLKD